ncbi:MAG: TusE/DsrC/DsvC family sulfur relay protein [Proteobacteria bacterium]|nr:TusE/DsrC/DsvC family sulfur relay protein [Pseudomonadota bacterium]MBU1585198.1 TusE/DsrC/DsvC family sulfur relay protein [Pseudomonadota bacterium]MBU2454511.1 TusE/DsrC/DsvC family sulfur relay protein [Pseudomonadota bacterium]MBU2629088.1 TusE/DsrC/DsvC family sulfur relay protein [Pseudomonadota bacterium]
MLNQNNTNMTVDLEGYLEDFESWTEETACELAAREGVSQECPLGNDRMDILRFIRDYYKKFEAFPIVRAVCKNIKQPKDCQYQQFPDPLVAWKIAGLPKPTPEVFAKIKHHA